MDFFLLNKSLLHTIAEATRRQRGNFVHLKKGLYLLVLVGYSGLHTDYCRCIPRFYNGTTCGLRMCNVKCITEQ